MADKPTLAIFSILCTMTIAFIAWRRYRKDSKYRWLIYGSFALVGCPVGWSLLALMPNGYGQGARDVEITWNIIAGFLIFLISLCATGIFIAMFFYAQIVTWLKTVHNKKIS